MYEKAAIVSICLRYRAVSVTADDAAYNAFEQLFSVFSSFDKIADGSP